MKGFLVLICGAIGGWFFADQNYKVSIERCDTEVLTCQVQINNDREAYFREMSQCQVP